MLDVLACLLAITKLFTCLCVEAPGEATIVVVVAEVTLVFVLPGVKADVVISAQLACTCMSAVLLVTILIISEVDDNIITYIPILVMAITCG